MTCPLCYSILKETDDKSNFQPYPDFEKPQKKKLNNATKVMAFISIILILLCVYINYLTYEAANKSKWSIVVVISLIYLWTLIRNTIISKSNISKKLFNQVLTLSILLIAIDMLAKTKINYMWSISYVVPILISISIITNVTVAASSKKRYQQYVNSLSNSLLLTVIPVILTIVFKNYISTNIPSFVCLFIGIITLISMFLFGNKTTKSEMNKKFHI